MSRQVAIGMSCTLALLIGGFWLSVQADEKPAEQTASQETKKAAPKKDTMHNFMRKKLAAAQDILEGLTTEDFEMIERGAKELNQLSRNAEFQITKDMLYIQHSNEFQRIVAKLEKSGKERKLDAASLQYVDLTMNCIECHRFVRDVLIAGEKKPAPLAR